MLRALYNSATGMVKDMLRQDTVSNNLANASTNGYKRDISVEAAFDNQFIIREDDPAGPDWMRHDPRPIIGLAGFGTWVDTVNTVHEQGALRETSNSLDFALVGEGFFEVTTPNGIRYTRDGSFSISPEGYLTTSRGELVNGQNGPIPIGDGTVTVAEDGAIRQNGEYIDKLVIVRFNVMENVLKEGDNLYNTDEAPEMIESPQVRQGYIEASNVNIVREMVDMIAVMRSYEANQKVIQSLDGTLDKAVNEISRTS